ncbi:hypothetical protein ABU614_07120 [Lysobacter firmicutimachus]|uniref:Uncharacterized protein n=1 Tax=Lysobacter firmicutimachus TaxID=1792846 RepID=A0AAU8N0E2_9GAMM|nr:hypothetical protein [Lysobacter antibioticus]
MRLEPDLELAELPWPILAFVEDHLANDDRSSDAELAAHFMANGLTRAQAIDALRFRQAYQDAFFLTHETPIRCGARCRRA